MVYKQVGLWREDTAVFLFVFLVSSKKNKRERRNGFVWLVDPQSQSQQANSLVDFIREYTIYKVSVGVLVRVLPSRVAS